MKPTDLRIQSGDVVFGDVRFRTPLMLSTGSIDAITYAVVRVDVQTRAGTTATGMGAILLSDLWSFPSTRVDHLHRDQAMRTLCRRILRLAQTDEYVDPLQWGFQLEEELPTLLDEVTRDEGLAEPLPLLAGLVCLAPWDAAVHDVWGRAAGRDTYTMYTAEFLNGDLSVYLGPEFAGRYPGDYLLPPKDRLVIQHAVGAADKLWRHEEGPDDPDDGLPNSLEAWIQRDGVYWHKLKVSGRDLEQDRRRIVDVYEVATTTLHRLGKNRTVFMQIDPNEACDGPEYLVELLQQLEQDHPDVFAALQYIEQPTPRDLSGYTYTLHTLSALRPVLIDESLDRLDNLERLKALGWTGVAVKSCKGQSHTLLAYCWARQKQAFITMQDLTNPGLALLHSAGLARRMALSVDAFEYNSRQYVPNHAEVELAGYDTVFDVRDGQMTLRPPQVGLY